MRRRRKSWKSRRRSCISVPQRKCSDNTGTAMWLLQQCGYYSNVATTALSLVLLQIHALLSPKSPLFRILVNVLYYSQTIAIVTPHCSSDIVKSRKHLICDSTYSLFHTVCLNLTKNSYENCVLLVIVLISYICVRYTILLCCVKEVRRDPS